mmetsp:Transcript_67401/g.154425  ORF Transcript_67401/g.154425 Transcript_67401/m.154425 type:complete len:135 (-) Transcript_67401:17-421(-)
MAFLIVFDANDLDSCQEALNLHMFLKDDWTKKDIDDQPRVSFMPHVVLVANKFDKDPGNEKLHVNLRQTKFYAKEQQIDHYTISSGDLQSVENLFQITIDNIATRTQLWQPDQQKVDDTDQGTGPAKAWLSGLW